MAIQRTKVIKKQLTLRENYCSKARIRITKNQLYCKLVNEAELLIATGQSKEMNPESSGLDFKEMPGHSLPYPFSYCYSESKLRNTRK